MSYKYRKSHCGDKTILRPSYLHNDISYTGKTTSLYWIGALGEKGINNQSQATTNATVRESRAYMLGFAVQCRWISTWFINFTIKCLCFNIYAPHPCFLLYLKGNISIKCRTWRCNIADCFEWTKFDNISHNSGAFDERLWSVYMHAMKEISLQ